MAVPQRTALLGSRSAGEVLLALTGLLSASVVLMAHRSWAPVVTPILGWLAAAVGTGMVVAGLVGSRRRPDSVVGPLLVASGLLFFVGRFWWAESPLLYTVGLVSTQFHLATLAHAVLAIPSGRLDRGVDRWVVRFVYLTTAVGAARHLFTHCAYGSACPENLVAVSSDQDLRDLVVLSTNLAAAAAATAVVALLVQRMVGSPAAIRRATLPVLLGVLGRVSYFVPANIFLVSSTETWIIVSTVFVPIGLTVGLLLGRAGAGRVGRLALELEETRGQPDALREGLAHTFGDPTLRLSYASASGWSDESGRPVAEPHGGPGRALHPVVDDDGETLAVVDTTDHLLDEPALVAGATAIARLVLDNRRLASQVEAQLERVRASRARLVEARDDERRRIERNLHDGAQQHLLSVALELRLAERSDVGYEALQSATDQAVDRIESAVRELQELGRGLHPTILTDKGLTAAVKALTSRMNVPVSVQMAQLGPDDLPGKVATTAYYVVAEALTNVVKHSGARSVELQVDTDARGGTRLVIRDDGRGGADATGGTGLQGLHDRVDAAGGQLRVASEPGTGTTITVFIGSSP